MNVIIPSNSVLLSYIASLSGADYYIKEKLPLNDKQRFDFGLITGLGWDIPIRKHFQFSLELRNNLGLHKLFKGKSYNGEYTKNESFALLFGLAYKI